MMAQKQSEKAKGEENMVRIEDPQPCGDGTFVVLKKPKWKVMRKGLSALTAQGIDLRNIDADPRLQAATLEMLDAMMPSMIADWNWTNEDGELLPLPSVDQSSWDDMELLDALLLVDRATPLIEFNKKN